MRAESVWLLLLLLTLRAGAVPPISPSPGSVVPVSLDHSLDSRKVHPGMKIRGEIMQNVPGSGVRRRAHIVGQVFKASGSGQGPAQLALRFDAIEEHGKRIPLVASLRAVASWFDVQQAEIPEETMDRGLTPETATTTQIGGEQVYRGGGPVASGTETVGTPTPYGVLGRLRPNRERGCRGAAGNDRPQALWLFSTNACGVYGFPNLQIAHAGRTDPIGTIILKSESGRVHLPSGTGILLRIQPAQ